VGEPKKRRAKIAALINRGVYFPKPSLVTVASDRNRCGTTYMRVKAGTNNYDALLTEVDAADLLSLSVRTLQAWRIRECGPAFVRAGRAIRYRRCDLITWIEANTNAPSRAKTAFA
jgi:Helix-turn-helix domain